MMNDEKKIVVAVSGGFDPIHIGHVRMIQEAAKLGDRLIVILNNDNWLKKKKGFAFMPQDERREILLAIQGVHEVIFTNHEENPLDMSVSRELEMIRPHIFANGGDRKTYNTPETEVCDKINCKMVFSVGRGGKVQSSSWLTDKIIKSIPNSPE